MKLAIGLTISIIVLKGIITLAIILSQKSRPAGGGGGSIIRIIKFKANP